MKAWGFVIVLTVLVNILFIKTINLHAELESSWFNGLNEPIINQKQQNVQPLKITYWGAPCQDMSFSASWLDSTSKQVTQEVSSCNYQASYGYMGNYGVKLSGTNTSYTFKSSTNTPINLYPIPNSKNVMSFSQTGSLQYKYIYIYKDLPGHIKPLQDVSGKTTQYKLVDPHDGPISKVLFADNSATIVQDGSLSYSGDGRYIFANFGRAQTLIDTNTNKARILGENTNPSSGTPNVRLAINYDGTMVFVANNQNGSYKIYNTTSCSPGSNLSNPEQCQKRDLTNLIHLAIPGIKTISSAAFLGDQKLELYVSHTVNTGYRTDKYIVTTPGYVESDMSYMALGDSFASGEGAQDFLTYTNTEGNHCHISSNSYSYLLKLDLSYDKAESVACSGGRMKDVYNDISESYLEDNPQASGKVEDQYYEEIYSNFLPGYRRQFEFVKRYKPAAITLSISGNDINFGKKLQYCILTQYSCYDSAEQKQNILNEIKAQFPNLVKTYQDLKTASPNTKIFVIGYPKLVLPGGNCALNVHLSDAELMLADEITEDLNTMIKLASKSTGVFYVDNSNTFSGHRLCEDKSWNLAVNGLTFGNDQPFNFGPISNATFHPNKLGHQLFESAILTQTNNLTASMPEPDTNVSVDDMPSRLSPNGDTTGTSVQPILEDGLFGSIVTTGDNAISLITNIGNYFNPGDFFNIEIHSTPTKIGTALATDSQTLSINAKIPNGIEPGPHEVHIYDSNIAGEPIDIYDDIIVASSKSDYDGDGIINQADQCTFVKSSSVDSDGDGIDDACDGVISEPHATPTPSSALDNNLVSIYNKIDKTNTDKATDRFVASNKNTNSLNKYANIQSTKQQNGTENRVGYKNSNKHPIWQTLVILFTSTPLGIVAVLLLDL